MQNRKQTQITQNNRDNFRSHLNQSQQLADLSQLAEKNILAIDCNGSEYTSLYPDKNVLCLETMTNIRDFAIPKDKFYRVIDNRQHNLVWPRIDVNNCAVLFNYSTIMKYRSIEEIAGILETVGEKYQPTTIVANMHLMHIDSDRLTDRFYDLAQIQLGMYVVREFNYSTHNRTLMTIFARRVQL